MTLIEANRLVSFGLVVLIWLVQVIIYPAFAEIAPERFTRWYAGYTRALAWIVAPLMLGQADGLDGGVIRRLVAANWVRTAAWTLAFLLLLVP